ncbi:hypothetical protein V8E36_001078 [Tilletia maclaganii]
MPENTGAQDTSASASATSSSTSYPPPPPRDYFTPRPHGRLDRFRKKYTDPNIIIVGILLLFLLSLFYPIPLPFFSESYRVLHGGKSASEVSKRSTSSACSNTGRIQDASSCCCDTNNVKSSQPTTKARYTPNMGWQKTFSLASRSKGVHLIQKEVEREVADGIRNVQVGMLYLFIQHTSAALTLNENYDPDVRVDMDAVTDKIVPENFAWRHTDEGPDDSASHTKASLFGSTVTIPITNGRLNLGTWQGVYLMEFRKVSASGRSRSYATHAEHATFFCAARTSTRERS